MASSNDDIIVNELLFYIRNKIHSTPKDAVIDSCIRFYSQEEVTKSIATLESALDIRMSKRNKTEKSDPIQKVLTDIYEKLFSLDAASSPILCFVAYDLSQIPRASDNSDSLATTEQILFNRH